MDQDTSTVLHQTLRDSRTINKKKKKRVSKYSKEELVILQEIHLLEDKVHQLTQAKRYMQKGEETELEGLVSRWRSSCQDIAKELIAVLLSNHRQYGTLFPKQVSSWGYDSNPDDGYERELSSFEQPADVMEEDTNSSDNIGDYEMIQVPVPQLQYTRQPRQYHHHQQSKEEEEEENDVTQLLSQLRIDPKLIHYSIEDDEFYE
ncbi:hypothetical protein BDA99DRAFT_557353 [Phascolomyces articulosus]|uniref:Swi5-dependent recombination DNA repair protein 1 homolog n=1 Tax=Phascolomyces articulosus TaxID=60185 RepID=A0AAD5PGV6_9FUNG|nr:hypothetical protein BDA99DRAFT_557353 [Phascolomyces articulosus]